MSDFLDYDGLQRYHELISKKLPTSAGTARQVLTSAGSGEIPVWKTGELVHYVTNASGTAGSAATNSYNRTQWIGTCDGVTSLYTGLMVTIKVPVAGVNRGVSLNINDLGEHPVMYNNTMFTTHYGVNTMVPLIYDAVTTLSIYVNNVYKSFTGCWKCVADYDSTNIYQLKHGSATVTSTTALGRYVLLLQKDENKFVPVTAVDNSVATNKTLTTDSFNPFGDILYYNYTTVINANSSPSAAYLYQQIAFDLRYSFNIGTTLTSNKDVYIVATPQADGSAKLYSTPIAQTLPSTENGLIYIRLGHAYNTYCVELFPTHPVYWYKNGKIQVYTGLTDTDTNTTYKFTIGSTTKGDSTNGVDLGTLKSETAASNGTTLSLVTTGEKATWNAKTSNTGTVTNITAGVGLNTTSNDTTTDGGSITTTGTLYLTKSGVTAGTYKSVTVDKYGRVTAGTNPTDTNTTYKFTIGTTTKGDSTNGVDLGTLKSETAAANGTTLSLVTTGEKATWNAKTSNVGTVTGVTVGSGGTNYTPTNGVVTIPAYPTTLPASDVYSWAKAASKPSYNYSEIGYTANAVTSAGGTLSLDGTIPLHVVTLTGNVSALTLSANPSAGHSCHVIFTATSARTISIAHDATNRVCPQAKAVTLTITAKGYAEVDFLNANNKIYVRGV